MITRTDILNNLAVKYELNNYLEIGVQVPEINFDKIVCRNKYGVDPDPKARANFQMTSDEFFAKIDFLAELTFIDGLHHADQVKKDFENALNFTRPGGFIMLHDCNPTEQWHTIVPRPTERGHWNGDVYRFAAGLQYPKVTINEDNGCMIIRKVEEVIPKYFTNEITWEKFDKNRNELLNLVSWEEFVKMEL